MGKFPEKEELVNPRGEQEGADEGLLAFEVGINQADEVAKLCLANGFSKTSVRKDYAGVERMVFAVKAACEGDEEKYANLLLEAAKEL